LKGWVRLPPKTQRGQGRFISSKNTIGSVPFQIHKTARGVVEFYKNTRIGVGG